MHGIRLNPGNIGKRERVREVVKAASARQVPIRIGVNAGSLEKDIVEKHGWPTAEGMVESAERHIRFLEDEGYREIKVSLKAHDVAMTVQANRLFSQRFDYPLHLGVTEAGTLLAGTVKSAAGLGILLGEGIGDTIRVSLTADPVEEVRVARMLLKSLGLKFGGATMTSCPTCGRCSVDMIPIAERVERRLGTLKGEVSVAVMGCEVNGPGEASAADVGVAYGHNGVGLLFRDGKIVKRMKAEELEEAVVSEGLAAGPVTAGRAPRRRPRDRKARTRRAWPRRPRRRARPIAPPGRPGAARGRTARPAQPRDPRARSGSRWAARPGRSTRRGTRPRRSGAGRRRGRPARS
jgi:(E)-4-hydroxy-3-methylbut-2-enyl-diphosphate synthase